MLSLGKNRIYFLDGLRGLAILGVVFFHGYSRWEHAENYQQLRVLQWIFQEGKLGVQLFFLISGFVIYLTLENSNSIKEFLFKRWFRLFPALIIASVIIYFSAGAIHMRPEGKVHLRDFLPSFSFIPPSIFESVFGVKLKYLDGAFWSLSVEVVFYLVAALFYLGFKKRDLNAIFYIYFFSNILEFVNSREFIFNKSVLSVIDVLVEISRMLGFQFFIWFHLGICVYKLFKNQKQRNLKIYILLDVILILYVSYITLNKDWLYNVFPVGFFMLAVFLPKFGRIFESRYLLFFGKISYPLYLIHQNFITGIANMIHSLSSTIPSWVLPIPGILISISLALIIFHIESFIKNLRKK